MSQPVPELIKGLEDARNQYESLRDEIVCIAETIRNTEIVILTASGAAFAWLATNKEVAANGYWLLPFLPAIGGLRNAVLAQHIGVIVRYLQQIEAVLFPNGESVVGWERYLAQHGRKAKVLFDWVFWIVLIGVSIVGTVTLYPRMKRDGGSEQQPATLSTPSKYWK